MNLSDNQQSTAHKSENAEQKTEQEIIKTEEETVELSEVLDKLNKEKEKNKELFDKYLRLQAELENFKKRVERDKCEFYKYALEKLLRDLLPVLDNFELAIQSAKENKNFDNYSEGIQLIYNQFKDTLEKEGLSYECSIGEIFDPCKHEAVLNIESRDHKKNLVIEEHKKGYFLKNRLLRPALVTVSKGPNEKKDERPSTEKKEE